MQEALVYVAESKPTRTHGRIRATRTGHLRVKVGGKWYTYLNADRPKNGKPAVCFRCRNAYAPVHLKGGICSDCRTEAVEGRRSWIEKNWGIELGGQRSGGVSMHEAFDVCGLTVRRA